jgi:hypothetical protein
MSFSAGIMSRSVPGRGGYWAAYYGQVWKLLYSTETASIVTALTVDAANSMYNATASSNKDVAGYMYGGGTWNTGVTATIYRWSFVNDSTRTLATTLSSSRVACGSVSNSGTAGYVAGGATSTGSGAGIYSVIDKLAYATESRSSLSSSLSPSRSYVTGVSSSGVAGYFMGGALIGNPQSSADCSAAISKLSYATDTVSTLGGALSISGYWASAVSNSGVAGYMMSIIAFLGTNYNNSPTYNYCNRISYTTDVVSSVSPYNLGNIDIWGAGVSSQGVAGWHQATGRTYRFNFSTEGVSQTGLSIYSGQGTAFSNSLA